MKYKRYFTEADDKDLNELVGWLKGQYQTIKEVKKCKKFKSLSSGDKDYVIDELKADGFKESIKTKSELTRAEFEKIMREFINPTSHGMVRLSKQRGYDPKNGFNGQRVMEPNKRMWNGIDKILKIIKERNPHVKVDAYEIIYVYEYLATIDGDLDEDKTPYKMTSGIPAWKHTTQQANKLLSQFKK